MNCYGYAFSHILYGNALVNTSGGYKQQPGEFARTSDKLFIIDNVVINNPFQTMENVVLNMNLDAARLGFSITRYYPTNGIVEQFGDDSRLIAVVTGNYDYHFYLQHNDGTWSHKPGSQGITNRALDLNQSLLLNTNINVKANEGPYSNGDIRFFLITRNAIIDQPHGQRCCSTRPCTHSQNTLYYREVAGDYLESSKQVEIGTVSARFDFANDHDVYCIIPQIGRTYYVTTTNGSTPSDIDCKVYNGDGQLIYSDTLTGNVSFSIILQANQVYYFDVYNYSKTIENYSFSIS